MRRKDREVTDNRKILDILSRCDTVRIGIQAEKYPYVLPVSFGLEIVQGKAVLYFHCAGQGLKTELLQKNPNVCVEGDIFIKTEEISHGITTRYESVIGFGVCEAVEDPDEKVKGLKLLTGHYGYTDYPLEVCPGMAHVKIYKICIETITGKQNLPADALQLRP